MPKGGPILALLCTLLLVTAGCLGTEDQALGEQATPDPGLPELPPVRETVERVVQVADRWSGEPSILATQEGTLLITGAGGFTRYVEDPTDAPGNAGQSYIWRSTDDGATWSLVDLDVPAPLNPLAPYRNAMPGVEGDLAQDEAGRLYFVDLAMLASNALSASEDDGVTWTAMQNPVVGLPGTDRPWVAGAGEDEVYVKYLQTSTGHRVARSTDGGQTFLEEVEIPACGQADLTVDRVLDELLLPCVGGENGDELSVLRTPTGQAMAWERLEVLTANGPASHVFNSLAATGDGHYVYAYAEQAEVDGTETTRVLVTTSLDAGETWSEPVTLSTENSTAVFPWVDAGPAGQVGVVWYETLGQGNPDQVDGTWYPVHAAFQLTHDGPGPEQATLTRLSETPIHEGAICTSGLGCVLDGRSEDRRLLDFFEVDVDQHGVSHVTWTDTVVDADKPTVWYGQVAPITG